MLIVTITRCDLRDEFAMADEAFALSPISARAELPSEADYDAIREAFMETARGRWFLGEYGKRNRNADTGMVLDAVARIEATIAAQKQPLPTNELPDALVLIRGLLSDARASAATTMSGSAAEEALAAVNKGMRIIREIAWTLREYGTDPRICDMLDTQVNAIESSHLQTIAPDKRDAVLATFDVLIRRIGELGGSGAAASRSDPETAAPSSTARDEALVATAEAATTDTSAHDMTAHDTMEATSPSFETDAATVMTSAAEVDASLSLDEEVVAASDSETETLDFETAQDLAVLDVIALEMAEPDIADSELAEPPQLVEPVIVEPDMSVEPDAIEPELFESEFFEPGLVEPDMIEQASGTAIAPEPVVVEPDMSAESDTIEPDLVEAEFIEPDIIEQVAETAIAPEPEPEPAMPSPPSLGAALIASGIVPGSSSAHDALAPIRRMSQAERIAFFS
jgi:hypothetical protein